MLSLFDSLLSLAAAGLETYNIVNKNEYRKKLMKLKRIKYEEEQKPPKERDQALLDNCEHELRIISSVVIQGAGTR